MKIFVREILPGGLEIIEDLAGGDIGLDVDGIELAAPLQVQAKIRRVGDTALAHVALRSKFPFSCARCLESSETAFSKEADFDYEVEPATEFIDLGEDIRQEIVLSFSQRMLCAPACKGLCPGCGVNLNKEKCKCS
jgi:uncharacterized protein